jgi:hypothetical protein
MRLDARLYADQRPGTSSTFVTDTELTRLVNLKVKELYDLLVEARGLGYYASTSTLAIVGATASYNLPSDFYQLDSVTLEWGTRDHELVDKVQTNRSRAWYTNGPTWSRWSPKGYRLMASTIEFLPTPASAVTCRLRYVPTCTTLTADADTFDGVNGWEKLIALGVAFELLGIDKRSPTPALQQAYAEQMARIVSLKDERDAEGQKEVIDVLPERGIGINGLRRRYLSVI